MPISATPLPNRPEMIITTSARMAPTRALYRVRHLTRYRYGDWVPCSHHKLHLLPRTLPGQFCRRAQISVQPDPARRRDGHDYFGNPVTYVTLEQAHNDIDIVSELVVEVTRPPPPDLSATPAWDSLRTVARGLGGPGEADAIAQFTFDSPFVTAGPDLADYARPSLWPGRPVGEALQDLVRRIHNDFTFDPHATTIATPLSEVMAHRRGVCQDFAHVMIGAIRSFGLPARYVSGYLRTLPPPGQPRLIGADASHAWVSAWCGSDLWVDFCPTNNRIADTDYITLAWGRDFEDVSPVRGVIIGSAWHELNVAVDVEPLE